MNEECEKIKNLITDYISGILTETEAADLQRHLKDCRTCSKYMRALKDEDKLLTALFAEIDTNMEARQQRVLQVINQSGQTKQIKTIPIWVKIMKNRVIKLTVAAVIIIAAIILLNPFGGSVTWAQVIEPILNARTIICDMIIGDDENNPSMHLIIVGSRMRRTMSNQPDMTHVIDVDSSKVLVLFEQGKTASYVDIGGQLGKRYQNYVEFLREVITNLKDNYRELGEQVIDGQKTIVFEASGPNESVKIWASPITAIPVRIELTLGQMFLILKNFEFDVPIDESLMSMEIPAGYTYKESEIDFSNINEQDFIESLRVWAEVMYDGTLPENIGSENAMKALPVLREKLDQANLSDEQATEMGLSFVKGTLFHQTLESQGNWRYVGRGVKLGDANTAVFWYQPEGSQTYRVIYGDLSVQDIAPENLPN